MHNKRAGHLVSQVGKGWPAPAIMRRLHPDGPAATGEDSSREGRAVGPRVREQGPSRTETTRPEERPGASSSPGPLLRDLRLNDTHSRMLPARPCSWIPPHFRSPPPPAAPGIPKPSILGLCPPSPLLRKSLWDKVCGSPWPPSFFAAGRKQRGRVAPRPGPEARGQAWSERGSLGKGPIWSLKEPQGGQPGSLSAQAQPQPPSKDSSVVLNALQAQSLAWPGRAS